MKQSIVKKAICPFCNEENNHTDVQSFKCKNCKHLLSAYGDYVADMEGEPKEDKTNLITWPETIVNKDLAQADKKQAWERHELELSGKTSTNVMIDLLKKSVAVGLAGVIILFTIGANVDVDMTTSTQVNKPKGSKFSAGEYSIAGDSFFGCSSKTYFQEVMGFIAQNDRTAFSKALGAGYNTGICIKFKEGEPVYVDERGGFLSGTLRLRRVGDTTSYWANAEAIYD